MLRHRNWKHAVTRVDMHEETLESLENWKICQIQKFGTDTIRAHDLCHGLLLYDISRRPREDHHLPSPVVYIPWFDFKPQESCAFAADSKPYFCAFRYRFQLSRDEVCAKVAHSYNRPNRLKLATTEGLPFWGSALQPVHQQVYWTCLEENRGWGLRALFSFVDMKKTQQFFIQV